MQNVTWVYTGPAYSNYPRNLSIHTHTPPWRLTAISRDWKVSCFHSNLKTKQFRYSEKWVTVTLQFPSLYSSDNFCLTLLGWSKSLSTYGFLLSNVYIRNTKALPKTNLEHEVENNLIQLLEGLARSLLLNPF